MNDFNSLSDTVVRLVRYEVQAEGADAALAGFEHRLQAVNLEIKQQMSELIAGVISQEKFEEGTKDLAREQAELAGKVILATKAVENQGQVTDDMVVKLRKVDAAIGRKGVGGGAVYGFQLLGQAADDAQYGISALTNNVQGLVFAFTGNGALAAAAGIAMVSVNQLIKRWDVLEKVLGTSIPVAETAASRMEALGKATHKTAEETEAFNKLKREQIELENLLKGMSIEAKKGKGAVEEALQEAGGSGDVTKTIAGIMQGKGGGRDQEVEDHLTKMEVRLGFERNRVEQLPGGASGATHEAEVFRANLADYEEQRATYEKAVSQRMLDLAGKMVEGSKTDATKLDELIRFIQRNPGRFDLKLLGGLVNATPEAIRENEANEAIGEQNIKRAKKEKIAKDHRQKVIDDAHDREALKVIDAGLRAEQAAITAENKGDKKDAKAGVKNRADMQKHRDQEVARLAKQLGGGAGGLMDQLAPAIDQRLADGQDAERVIKDLGAQVAGRIKGAPGVGLYAGATGEQIVRDAVARQRGAIGAAIGQGANPTQAAGIAGEQAQGKLDARGIAAQRRGVAEGRREDKEAEAEFLAELTDAVMNEGFDPPIAANIAKRMFAHMKAGMDQITAFRKAVAEVEKQLQPAKPQAGKGRMAHPAAAGPGPGGFSSVGLGPGGPGGGSGVAAPVGSDIQGAAMSLLALGSAQVAGTEVVVKQLGVISSQVNRLMGRHNATMHMLDDNRQTDSSY